MDINSEIERISTNIASAYIVCSNKGATMPATQNLDNLSNCVASIQPSAIGIDREIVNGVYQIPSSSFTWSLPSTATNIGSGAMYHAFHSCTGLTGALDLSSLTTVSGSNAMSYAFQGCTGLTSVDLSSLTTVSGNNAMRQTFHSCTGLTGALDLSSLTTVSGGFGLASTFSGCTGLTSVDLSSLTTVSNTQSMVSTFSNCIGLTSVNLSNLTNISGPQGMQQVFSGCTGLTSVDLPNLTTVSGGSAMSLAFSGCSRLTNVNFNSLQTIGTNSSSSNYDQFESCFNNCSSLTSITFPALEKIYCTGGSSGSYGTFASNNKVQKMYFPKLDTITYGSGASAANQEACKNIFGGCTSLTELHFAAANQAAIEASPGYPTLWGLGAGNVNVYFDLTGQFVQPVLSSNGTLGGSSFAVSGYTDLWKAFDGDSSTYVSANPLNCTIYNPTPIKITSIDVILSGSFASLGDPGTIQGSNDNSSWTNISFTYSVSTLKCTLNNTNFYKYYKFTNVGVGQNRINEMTITAEEN